jgi:hypothetical protein
MVNIKHYFFTLLIVCFCIVTKAQNGHLILLKERGVTIHTFSLGNYINFRFSNGQWITGYVTSIKKDTIEVNQFALQTVMTMFGTYGEDTLRLGRLQLHVNEIEAFAKDKGHYNSVFTNGAYLQAGGIGYLFLNIVNSLLKNDPILEKNNIPKLIGGAAALVAGKLIRKANPDYRAIGKRFSVEIL